MLAERPNAVPDRPLRQVRAGKISNLLTALAILPVASGLATSAACLDSDQATGHGQEVTTPVPEVDLNQLVADYLSLVEKHPKDIFGQTELIGNFPVATSTGQKTLDECLGNISFAPENELPSESGDRLIVEANLSSGEVVVWNFEKQAGVWELHEVPECPVN